MHHNREEKKHMATENAERGNGKATIRDKAAA
jgi:hypothetical protein